MCELERDTLRGGLNWAFTVARSLYENVSLEALSEDYPGGSEPLELRELEAEAAPPAQALVDRIESAVLP